MNKIIGILFIASCVFLSSCKSSKTPSGPAVSVTPNQNNPFDPNNPTNCLAIDTDGDGLIDCIDPDVDNDGFLNEIDAFPYDATEWKDSDGDKVGDNSDAFPLDPFEWRDFDNDGVGDNSDEDDDNDGILDIFESINYENNILEFTDIDGDKIGNNADEDLDNDGILNIFDTFVYDSSGYFDIDHDRAPNNLDSDIDGDTYPNSVDAFPYNNQEWLDTDHDLIGNNTDPDSDNDGYPDAWEDFPLDTVKQFDTDGDGYSNDEDAFPYDITEWKDSDNDSVGDNKDEFPNDPTEWADTNHNGIGDNKDPDADGDGYQNCTPIDLGSVASCNQDAFPLDRTEWVDADKDLIGNNADEDDDNDGVLDIFDFYPLDNKYLADFDQDGVPDYEMPITPSQYAALPTGKVWTVIDEDIDNDGVLNIFDALPYNRTEYFDIDGDGVGSNSDADLDGDGVPNLLDKFPRDPTESLDYDLDNIGDNADEDDDNDGVLDIFDALINNKFGWSDLNNDGLPDQSAFDLDGDGRPNGTYSCSKTNTKYLPYSTITYTMLARVNKFDESSFVIDPSCNYPANDPVYKCAQKPLTPDYYYTVCAFPQYKTDGTSSRTDLYMWNSEEWSDNDRDGLPDNSDEDSDNDGVLNIFDKFENDTSKTYNSWADNNNDGIPDMQYRYDNNVISQRIINGDVDGDGVSNSITFSCITNASNNLVCAFPKSYTQSNIQNPRYDGISPEPQYLTIVYDYDIFPYNPLEQLDYNGNRIGDNSDIDIDGDGKTNCIPLDLNTVATCNQDELPAVGQFDEFMNVKYNIYSVTGQLVQAVSYCANPSDCYYKKYDRDNDGLTDYEEFLESTNPISADSDGDGVPDGIELMEGTLPYNKNSFKDSDGDGIPDYLDKTPRGAYSVDSLKNQIESSSTCRTKTFQEICESNDLGLCKWDGASCKANPIQLTENLTLNKCLNVDGEVIINALDRKTITFDPDAINDTSCDFSNPIPLAGNTESKITLKNIDFRSTTINQFINTTGKFLRIDNSSFYMSNNIMPTAISFDNTSDGVVELYKSSFNLNLVNYVSALPYANPGLNLLVKSSNIQSSVFYCNSGTGVDLMTNYACVKTLASTSSLFNWSFFLIERGNSTTTENNTWALNNQSNGATTFLNKNYFSSPFRALKTQQSSLSYSSSNMFVNDKTTASVYKFDGVSNGLYTGALGQSTSNNVFDSLTTRIFCTTNPRSGVNQSANYLYLDATPVDSNLNSQLLQYFSTNSAVKAPVGNFGTLSDWIAWTYLTQSDPGEYDAINKKALLRSSSTSGSGIGSDFTSIKTNRKYKIRFLPEEYIIGENNILLDINVFNKTTPESQYLIGKVRFKPDSSYPNSVYHSDTRVTDFYVNYVGDYVEAVFSIPSGSASLETISITIQNNTSSVSRDVTIDNITVTESDEYSIQYPGIISPICPN